MTYVKKEIVTIVDLLVEYYNDLVNEFGENDVKGEELKRAISDAEIGEVSFCDKGLAAVKYRNYIIREDV